MSWSAQVGSSLPRVALGTLLLLAAALVASWAVGTPPLVAARELIVLSDQHERPPAVPARVYSYRTATENPSPEPTPSPAIEPRRRVGLQAGHWRSPELPDELAILRRSTGAQGNGWSEAAINLDIARRVAALLEKQNVQVDLLPATVPEGYRADAFVAIHGDANGNTSLSGYKLARASWSLIPKADDALLAALSTEYRLGTALAEHLATVTAAMREYYAFENRHLKHAVAPTTPSVILEMGFLTNASDRRLLQEQPDRVAQAVAQGILRYLRSLKGTSGAGQG